MNNYKPRKEGEQEAQDDAEDQENRAGAENGAKFEEGDDGIISEGVEGVS